MGMEAFFACLYHAALRPSEAVILRGVVWYRLSGRFRNAVA
jgi:hypothetical protein